MTRLIVVLLMMKDDDLRQLFVCVLIRTALGNPGVPEAVLAALPKTIDVTFSFIKTGSVSSSI